MVLANKIEFIRFETELEIKKIEIDEKTQVRIEKRLVDIPSLAENIENIGLIEPIVVSELEKGKRYKLIVGRRRLLAFQHLKRENIPAKIIKPLDDKTALLVSFGENLQRRDITIHDKYKAAETLFKLYDGNKQEKLQKIAKDLNVKSNTVIRYLQYSAVPDEVMNLVREKKLSESKAWQITAALLGNAEKIIETARKMAEENVSTPEKENIIKAAKELGPEASVAAIMKRARNLPPLRGITIHIEISVYEELKEQTEKRGFERTEDLITDIIDQYMENEGLK